MRTRSLFFVSVMLGLFAFSGTACTNCSKDQTKSSSSGEVPPPPTALPQASSPAVEPLKEKPAYPGKVVTCAVGRSCAWECPAGGCKQTCASKASCTATCVGGACTQTCADDATCDFACEGGKCTQACGASKACKKSCAGNGCT